jgi:chorismate mutase
MAHVETSKSAAEISHIYLHGAKALRRNIAQ